jgi:signal transduction histidine kinase|tara:strand:+ start:232 stop:438 length:207 start_codon:yes stop_codon:yes gene_type:complete
MSKQSKLETFKEMLDDKSFSNVLSEQSVKHLKDIIDAVAEEQYNKGYADGSNQLTQIFTNLVGNSARN